MAVEPLGCEAWLMLLAPTSWPLQTLIFKIGRQDLESPSRQISKTTSEELQGLRLVASMPKWGYFD